MYFAVSGYLDCGKFVGVWELSGCQWIWIHYKQCYSRNYIGCIERGEKSPSLDVIFDITVALNCDVCEFFKEIWLNSPFYQ